jgi:hypothetical protein
VDNAGVVTGLVLREPRLLFEDSDGVPAPSQLMGSGQSDDPCPSDNDVTPHSAMSTRAGPEALDSRGLRQQDSPVESDAPSNRPRHTQANQPGRSLL